jgi:hypothetical protein
VFSSSFFPPFWPPSQADSRSQPATARTRNWLQERISSSVTVQPSKSRCGPHTRPKHFHKDLNLSQEGAANRLQLENKVRKLAINTSTVYVITGTIFYSPQIEAIGGGKVVALIVRGELISVYAVIIPNQRPSDEPLHTFTVTLAEVEGRTGLYFLH